MASIAVASAGMVPVTTATKLSEALAAVPDLLLDEDHLAERNRALETLAELASVEGTPTVLVVIGGGGSGKSSVVNAIVGFEVAAVSPIRPTTTGVQVIGRGDLTRVEGTVEYVLTDRIRAGLLVVDTPSWDVEKEIVLAAVAGAHTVVVVVTPARYADAVTSEMVTGLSDSVNVVMIANRLPADPHEADDVLDDIETAFGAPVWAQIDEGGAFELPSTLLSEMPVDTRYVAKRAALATVAANAGRQIARSVSGSAADLGIVKGVLADAKVPVPKPSSSIAAAEWPAVREALGALVADAITGFDARIIDESKTALAARIGESLPVPDGTTLRGALDVWQAETARTFRRRSEPKWRRASTLGLVERWSWVACIDTDAVPPRRVTRSMRGAFDATVLEARSNLAAIVDPAVQARTHLWHAVVSEMGEYRPGALFAASDALDGGEPADD